jgi:hypothetical protein
VSQGCLISSILLTTPYLFSTVQEIFSFSQANYDRNNRYHRPAMTTSPEPRDVQTEMLERFQAEVLERFDRLEQRLDNDIQRLDERTNRWEERFLQLSRDNLAISRTVIIAAATVVIFGSLLDKADILVEGAARLLGK